MIKRGKKINSCPPIGYFKSSRSELTVRVLVVMLPQRSNHFLTPDVPNREGHALYRGHGLHVKPNGRKSLYVLVQFDLVQNCCLAFEKKILKYTLRIYLILIKIYCKII